MAPLTERSTAACQRTRAPVQSNPGGACGQSRSSLGVVLIVGPLHDQDLVLPFRLGGRRGGQESAGDQSRYRDRTITSMAVEHPAMYRMLTPARTRKGRRERSM